MTAIKRFLLKIKYISQWWRSEVGVLVWKNGNDLSAFYYGNPFKIPTMLEDVGRTFDKNFLPELMVDQTKKILEQEDGK